MIGWTPDRPIQHWRTRWPTWLWQRGWPLWCLLLPNCMGEPVPMAHFTSNPTYAIQRTLQPAWLERGQQGVLTIDYVLPKESLHTLAPLIPDQGIHLLDHQQTITQWEQELWHKQEQFVFLAETAGIYLFPAMQITLDAASFGHATTVETPDIWLQIVEPNTSDRPLTALLPPLRTDWPLSSSRSSLLALAWLVPLLTLGVGILGWQRRQRRPIQLQSLSAAEIGLAALEQLGHQTIVNEAAARQWHADMASILRTYLIHHFSLSWQERTTPELLQLLQQQRQLPANVLQILIDIFTACDNVKFSGVTPSSQHMMALLQSAKQCVQSTHQERP